MWSAYIVLCLALFSAFGNGFQISAPAPEYVSTLCQSIHRKLEFRVDDRVLGGLGDQLKNITICDLDFRMRFWERTPENQMCQLLQISDAADSQIGVIWDADYTVLLEQQKLEYERRIAQERIQFEDLAENHFSKKCVEVSLEETNIR
jgi:hypothetical protein